MHGIPGDRVLREGDQISIDCGAIVDGLARRRRHHGAASGEVDRGAAELSRVTEEALWAGPRRPPGRRPLNDIGARRGGLRARSPGGAAYGIVEEYVGHGIGTSMHMEPNVPNYAVAGQRPPARGGHGPRRRADGLRRRPGRARRSPTTGPS